MDVVPNAIPHHSNPNRTLFGRFEKKEIYDLQVVGKLNKTEVLITILNNNEPNNYQLLHQYHKILAECNIQGG